jgi:hypothetical protein
MATINTHTPAYLRALAGKAQRQAAANWANTRAAVAARKAAKATKRANRKAGRARVLG